MKRQLLAWVSILVFFISINGIVIYKHICLSNNKNSVSLNQLLCDEVEKDDDCCSNTKKHSDCCDLDFAFEKYTPSGKSELEKLSYKIVWDHLKILPTESIQSIPHQYCEVLSVFPNIQNPFIQHPKTVSERLSEIQSYLC